jgi:hypothetical protein
MAGRRPSLSSEDADLGRVPGDDERARKREGLRVCRAGWLLGLTVREYREIETGEAFPDSDTYERISELYRWPQTFVVT